MNRSWRHFFIYFILDIYFLKYNSEGSIFDKREFLTENGL
jgi:hypothetical protein